MLTKYLQGKSEFGFELLTQFGRMDKTEFGTGFPVEHIGCYKQES
jgi:hypothetical protein